jgi:hypothetical protein
MTINTGNQPVLTESYLTGVKNSVIILVPSNSKNSMGLLEYTTIHYNTMELVESDRASDYHVWPCCLYDERENEWKR